MSTPRLPAQAGEFDTVTLLRDVVAVVHELANDQAMLKQAHKAVSERVRQLEQAGQKEARNGRVEEGAGGNDRVGGSDGDRGAAAGVRVPRGGKRLGA